MKKLLSVLLASLIALAGMGAVSAQAPEDAENTGLYAQGLNDPLPEVESIEAVWNGDILIYMFYLTPQFTVDNVEVTVNFADGGSEVLTRWWNEGEDWSWNVGYQYDASTNKVTFYYMDSKFFDAYIAALDDPDEEYDWDALLATMPQCVLTVPANLLEQYVDAQKPLTALSASSPASVTVEPGAPKVLAFTPEADGVYYFTSKGSSASDPVAALTDNSLTTIGYGDNTYQLLLYLDFAMTAELKAGETYYLFAGDWMGGSYELSVTQLEEIHPALLWVYNNLLFGKLWLPRIAVDGLYLLPGQSQFGLLGQYLFSLFNTPYISLY